MEWVSGNIFIRPNGPMAAGAIVRGHRHNFDHTTIIWEGAFRIDATLPNGQRVSVERRRGEHVLIRANVEHEITALEDGSVFWCVYAHRTPQGDVVQTFTGWPEAYT